MVDFFSKFIHKGYELLIVNAGRATSASRPNTGAEGICAFRLSIEDAMYICHLPLLTRTTQIFIRLLTSLSYHPYHTLVENLQNTIHHAGSIISYAE